MTTPDLQGKTLVITGTFSGQSRKDLTTTLKDLGAKVSSSVSGKTSAVVAGQKAGSKVTKAHAKGVPVLSEAYVTLLLDGSKTFDELTTLARTLYVPNFNLPEDHTHTSFNQIGGLPPGIGAKRWPKFGSTYLRHLFTLDLSTMPALQAIHPTYHTASFFAEADADMYSLSSHEHGSRVVWSTHAEAKRNTKRPPKAPESPRMKPFEVHAKTWSSSKELQHLNDTHGTRILGPPTWIQGDMNADGFILQAGERFGVSGDGLIYVFEHYIDAQFT